MGKNRGRLDPGEVKRALAKQAGEPPPEPVFDNPFAAAFDQLSKLKLKPAPRGRPAPTERAQRKADSPSPLAEKRAQNLAARKALAEAVKPVRRSGAHVTPVEPPSSRAPETTAADAPAPAPAPGSRSAETEMDPVVPPPPRLL
jgi:hypothetical protein